MSDSDLSQRSRPYAPACDRNREPILEALKVALPPRGRVLEIGSGTGQHAAFFSRHLPQLSWLPSDLPENLPGILEWRRDAGSNCMEPVAVDLLKIPHLTSTKLQVVRNTTHLSLKLLVEEVDCLLAKTHQPFLQLTAINYGTLRQVYGLYARSSEENSSRQVS